MIKKITGIFAVAAVMAAAGYGVLKNANQNELNDLALANIEALAAGENNGSNCCIGSAFQVLPSPGGWDCYNDRGNSCCPIC